MPGRPRSGEGYRNYHHPEGFARRGREPPGGCPTTGCGPGPEWFDNDHPVGSDGRPATPETLPREHRP
ncbi:MAG: hypothetical protein V9E94_01410 [Microthrixaceae bacterium]